jgi:hypothetical protein
MVVSFWSYPTILKVCCCVCMLLLVLLDDWVTFSGILTMLLTKIDWSSVLPSCRHCCCCCLNRVRVVLTMMSLLLKTSSCIGRFMTMVSLIGTDSWFSGDVFGCTVRLIVIYHHCGCCSSLLQLHSFIWRLFLIQPWDCSILFPNWTAVAPSPLLYLLFWFLFSVRYTLNFRDFCINY